ncbi:unnamed protein product [Diamesa serratosioi]
MNIIVSVVGGVLLYEYFKVQKMIDRHEKCSKSMERMQDTMKKCSDCNRAINDVAETCNQFNISAPSIQNTSNNCKSSTPNTSNMLYESFENHNQPEQTQVCFDNTLAVTKLNKCEDCTSPTGKITKNRFFNYIREQRPKRCGQQQKIIVKESAFKWKQLAEADKLNYTYFAVRMREKSISKDQTHFSDPINKNTTNNNTTNRNKTN